MADNSSLIAALARPPASYFVATLSVVCFIISLVLHFHIRKVIKYHKSIPNNLVDRKMAPLALYARAVSTAIPTLYISSHLHNLSRTSTVPTTLAREMRTLLNRLNRGFVVNVVLAVVLLVATAAPFYVK